MTNPSVKMARWSAGHPWRAIAAWFLFVIMCLGIGIAAGGNAATSADFRIGEAGRAEAMAAEGGLQQKPVEHVLITARPGAAGLDASAADAAARDAASRMKRLPEVESVSAPIRSGDGTSVRVEVTLRGPELEGRKHVGPLLAQTAQVGAAHPGVRVEETGGPSISKGIEKLRGEDLSRTEVIALPITLITLLVVFGSVSLAVVPILLALTSITAAVGLSMLASHVFPDAGVSASMILLIGMAVGVDYTLFYLKREREERARSGGRLSPRAVVELAAATSGRAVVLSGLAVAVSSATLYLADDVIFSSIATGAIVVTLVAVVSSLTVLPALLAKLGQWAERRAARRARRGKPARRLRMRDGGRITTAMLRPVERRPAVTLIVGVLVMLALAAPLLNLNLTDMGRESHPRDIPAMRTYDRLNAAFPELKAMHQVVVRADPGQADEVAAALRDLAARAADDRGPSGARLTGASELRASPDGRISVLELAVPHYGSTDEARTSLTTIRGEHVPATVGRLGVETAVTGDVARYTDYPEHQKDKLPMIIGSLLLVTFAMTVWAFRSVALGLVGVLLNLLSAGAALGLLTLVFQGTWAEGALDFTSTGSIGSRVPLFLFVILFGLSMDYQVFVISRIREAVLAGASTREAVLGGIRRSAGVVTSAAFVMVTVFASFVALHIMEMKQMGFALAVAVLLDAVVIRIVILPSLMLLLGDRCWWPSRPSGRGHDPVVTGLSLEKVV
ncbi:MMPL family transporter [Actinomadura soli]|uniref:MMPL family transporter n=1 Tax=Actinomadura soli TaxID=2508997 RepID=A0A5C4JBZ1_9ACTN|nr:MMPL family transporter [Actinomadura soli]TMQ98927.1 MMPL family transporter [Actinomadura soli]